MAAWTDSQKAAYRAARNERDIYKEARAARRAANQEEWRRNHINSNQQTAALREIAAPELPEPEDTSPLEKLRAIMLDSTQLLYRRLDAAELVLAYELAPGALVDVPPSEVAANSYRFLRGVADAPDVPERLQFRALKAILSINHKRAAAASTTGQVEKQKLRRRLGEAAPEMSVDAQWPPSDIAARLDGLRRKRR
jgi:hypothetical protein